MIEYGPTLPVSKWIHALKYRGVNESFKEAMSRVANELRDSEEHYHLFRDILLEQKFLPGGRVQAAIGSPRQTTAFNCFVSKTIPDSMDGIMDAAKEAATTMRLGGGIGYDFCLAQGTQITTPKGLQYVQFLNEGDEIIGFPEELNLQKSVFEKSFVESNKKIVQPTYRITTDKGVITASENHLFVARTKDVPKKKGEGFRWIKTKDLQVGNQIAFTTKPWHHEDLSDSWLAGIFDGEGWASGTNVGVAQNQGPVADRIRYELNNLEIDFREHQASDTLVSFVCKGKWEAYKLLSQLQTTRLTYPIYGKKLCGKSSLPARIISVEFLGEKEVWAIRTSTRTLIANGFLSHNSSLRPRNDLIRSLDSRSSGPVSFMGIFDSVCYTIKSAGHRRGAQMGVLRIDHPDIEEFIEAKANTHNLTQFNVSVGVTDAFMKAVIEDTTFDLVWNGRVYNTIRAVPLWEKILRLTWDWAEPGILFIDTINKKNNLSYCERIATSNPCGEQPLPPYGACLLGSFNLTKYLRGIQPEGFWAFDYDAFKSDIPPVIRAMDNIIDRTIYPLTEQEMEAKNKRRMGIGITGTANAIEALGFPYGSAGYIAEQNKIMTVLRDEAYRASIELAVEKGPFPLYDDRLLRSKFARTLPKDIRADIKRCGLRNSHLLSVAPTGTISLSADNISSGIEPVYDYEGTRKIQTPDGERIERYEDYGLRVLGVRGRTAARDVSVDEHVNVLIAASQYVDSACSKTCNVSDDTSWDEFKDVYMKAYLGGASGCTTFRAAGKRYGILTASSSEDLAIEPETPDNFIDEKEGAACYYDVNTGLRTCE